MKVNLRVFTGPLWVDYECPECDSCIEIRFRDFIDDIGDPDDGVWENLEISCPKCGKELQIGRVDWD